MYSEQSVICFDWQNTKHYACAVYACVCIFDGGYRASMLSSVDRRWYWQNTSAHVTVWWDMKISLQFTFILQSLTLLPQCRSRRAPPGRYFHFISWHPHKISDHFDQEPRRNITFPTQNADHSRSFHGPCARSGREIAGKELRRGAHQTCHCASIFLFKTRSMGSWDNALQ